MRYKKEELSALDKIYDASAKLIKEKEYNKISISEVIREANISRSTFYMYFKTKDQIFIHICNDIFDHIFAKKLSKEKGHDFSLDNEEDLTKKLTHSFYHFLEDKELILAILNSGASNIFLGQLRKRIKPLIESMINKKMIGKNDIPIEIKVHQYIMGYTALLQYYLRHGYDLAPEIITEYYLTLYK